MQAPTILLAEDDPNDAFFIRRAFERTYPGLRVSVVSNGHEALKYLDGQLPYTDRLVFPVPNLVLLDLFLPVMTGFQVLRWLRERLDFKGLPVIVLTSSSRDADSKLAYELGADSYLVKPCALDQLTHTMAQVAGRWLGRSRWFKAGAEDQREAA